MSETWLVLPFPEPDTPELQKAYRDLYLSEEGSEEIKKKIGDPKLLPRPWDPATCTNPKLRAELWAWLDAVVTWFNHEYTWKPGEGIIEPCWPLHPHLVHEIAVLADQRRRAGLAKTSGLMEEWHRYGVPNFYDRMKLRAGGSCDGGHKPWPSEPAFSRHNSRQNEQLRRDAFAGDITAVAGAAITAVDVPTPNPSRPKLSLVDASGSRIDPATGEVLE